MRFITLFINIVIMSISIALKRNIFKMSNNPFQTLFKTVSTTSSGIKSVGISGSTGLLGSELVKSLESKNIKVIRISTSKSGDVSWNPSTGYISNIEILEGLDAFINLSGENVGSGDGPLAILGRWSDTKKSKILNSRVDSIKLLVDSFSKLKKKPKVFLSASAIGYYGFKDSSTIFDESSKKGKGKSIHQNRFNKINHNIFIYYNIIIGFLADVCENIENEALKAQKLGIRTVIPRFSVILSKRGGVLGKLLLPFSFGVGGIIGSGQQGFSWVTIQDAVRALEFSLETSSLNGVCNIVASNPTNNAEFTSALGK